MKYHSQAFAAAVVSELPSSPLDQTRWNKLAGELRMTPRQTEITHLLLQAYKDKQIASELGLQLTTVRMHLRQIFTRLQVGDRTELVLKITRLLCAGCPHRPSCQS